MVVKKQFETSRQSMNWQGRELSLEIGKLAVQADASIRMQMGDNVMLYSTTMEKNPREGLDFLPLMIDMRESFSAAGRIGGAVYRRREGRPSDQAILNARLTDRALRPMFPKGMINDIVVSVTPLALDHQMSLGVMHIIGSSLSILAAGIPFDGPVGAAQIGYLDGQFIVNPSLEQLEKSDLNLLVAGKKGSINMIECEGKEFPDNLMKEAFTLGQKVIDESCDWQADFIKTLEIKPQEITFNKPTEKTMELINSYLTSDKLEAMAGNTKTPFNELYNLYEKDILALAKEQTTEENEADFTESKLKMGVFNAIKTFIRSRTIETGKRIDDRGILDIRPLYCETDNLPRVHGSGLFWRGDTQVLSTVTLGGPTDYLVLDDMEHNDVQQRYFHHYNFPPFSTGEAKAMRGTGRREIGHGRLAEKALEFMIPSKESFPYSIRVVSECLGSGGSTSMGSVCGSTLALMDAGVPIKKPVAGIAMGLMTEHLEDGIITKYQILNDLMGTEDFTGDMDFKVAGTKEGINAIQLDTKLKGLPLNIVHETIDRASAGYKEIMDFMLQTIAEPRAQVKEYAPKIHVFSIKPEKIKEVIGKGGEMIDKIIEQCDNIKIDFEDDGTCFLTHSNQAIIEKAKNLILEIATDLEVGQSFEAKVVRIADFGLFVQLPKGKQGLCHVSNLGQKYPDGLDKHFKLGDLINVTISNIGQDGKIAVKRKLA
ncbi:polyribonucleotide nucleotidyltransferase [Candidatus Gracilibacteria bacterium]|nr:polyribonucleotide nucleotidyltransferase [Candidatus Gracilibacteria bacterium]